MWTEVIADRFGMLDSGQVIDLATNEQVELLVAAAGTRAEQLRWSARCDRFARLHHAAMATLVDYGFIGGRRFEAWRVDGPWRGSRLDARRSQQNVQAFLAASGWTSGAIDALREVDGRAVVRPDADCGYERRTDGVDVHRAVLPLGALGLALVERPALAALVDVLSHQGTGYLRVLGVAVPADVGADWAVRYLARAARIHGYVPRALTTDADGVSATARGRSMFLIARCVGRPAWHGLVRASLAVPMPHLLLLASAGDIGRADAIQLDRATTSALIGAVRPNLSSGQVRKRVVEAARSSGGYQERMAQRLWGSAAPRPHVRRGRHAAEAAASYGHSRTLGENVDEQ